jgi:hypothetical protein
MSMFLIIYLFVTVYAENIVFNINEIQCTNINHIFIKYYGQPCDIWNKQIKQYYDKSVICKIHKDSNNNDITGCSPAFGYKEDDIYANYTVTKKCYFGNNCKYKLNAKVSLYNPIHPIFYMIFIIIIIIFTFNDNNIPWYHRPWYHRPLYYNRRNTYSYNKLL